MNRSTALTFLVALTLLSLSAAPAFAEPPPVRFEANLGAYAPRLTTKARVDGTGGLVGASIDFEDNFGLDDKEIVPLLQVNWWFKKKHGLSVFWFDLQRESTGESTVDLRVGDTVFSADVPIDVSFDTQAVSLTYGYKFFNNHQRSFGINFGFNINEIDLAMATTGGGPSVAESAEATAPLPTLGVNGHVMLSKKWKFYGTLGAFALSFEEYDGLLLSLQGGFIHNTFKHVGFGVGVNTFKVRVDSTNEDFLGRIDYGYNGVTAYVNFRVGGTG